MRKPFDFLQSAKTLTSRKVIFVDMNFIDPSSFGIPNRLHNTMGQLSGRLKFPIRSNKGSSTISVFCYIPFHTKNGGLITVLPVPCEASQRSVPIPQPVPIPKDGNWVTLKMNVSFLWRSTTRTMRVPAGGDGNSSGEHAKIVSFTQWLREPHC